MHPSSRGSLSQEAEDIDFSNTRKTRKKQRVYRRNPCLFLDTTKCASPFSVGTFAYQLQTVLIEYVLPHTIQSFYQSGLRQSLPGLPVLSAPHSLWFPSELYILVPPVIRRMAPGHRCLHCTSAFILLPPRPTFNPIIK